MAAVGKDRTFAFPIPEMLRDWMTLSPYFGSAASRRSVFATFSVLLLGLPGSTATWVCTYFFGYVGTKRHEACKGMVGCGLMYTTQ